MEFGGHLLNWKLDFNDPGLEKLYDDEFNPACARFVRFVLN